MLWRCARSAKFYWLRGGVHSDKSIGPLQCHSKKRASSCHIVHNLYQSLPCLHTSHKNVASRRVSVHVLLLVRIPLILRCLVIIIYIQWIVSVSRQYVLERFHKTQVSYISLLFKLPFASVVRHDLVSAPQVAHTLLRSQMDFLFEVLRFRFAKHVWLLKCLLHSAQGILTAKKSHGGLAIQSLHVLSQRCVTSVAHDLLHEWHTYIPASRPLYSRSRDSTVRHRHRVD